MAEEKSEAWAVEKYDGVEMKCVLLPRSASSQIVGLHGGELKIRVQAPPVEGKANEELCRLLSKSLGVPRSSIQILSGMSSRHKRVLVRGKILGELRGLFE